MIYPEKLDHEQTTDYGVIEQDSTVTDSVTQYMSQAGRHDLLTPEQEASLGKQLKAAQAVEEKGSAINVDPDRIDTIKELGRSAFDSLFMHNLRLVVHLAHKYKSDTEELADVVQVGNMGLKRAVDKFEPTKGYRFTTYANWWIRQAIQRGRPDNSIVEPVRFPTHFRQDATKILTAYEKIDDGNMTKAEITSRLVEATGFSQEKIEKTELRKSRFASSASLDQPIKNRNKDNTSGGAQLADIVQDETAPNPESVAMAAAESEDLHNRLRRLRKRDREVIIRRFGLLDGSPQTLQEVGDQLGLTREAIRQIEARSLEKIRRTYEVDRRRAS